MKKAEFTTADSIVDVKIRSNDHILRRIKDMIDWSRIERVLGVDQYNRPNHCGNDFYPPLLMFKMLFIQTLYGFSDRELAERVEDSRIFSWFCDLMLFSKTPDYSSVCRWRKRFTDSGAFEHAFDEINSQISEAGYDLHKGKCVIIDATLIHSASRPRNKTFIEVDLSDPDTGLSNPDENTDPCDDHKINVFKVTSKDPDAKWGKNGSGYVHGFKDNTAVNGDGFILGSITTPANVHDGSMLEPLIEKINPAPDSAVVTDKGYDSAHNREVLSKRQLKDKIMQRQIPRKPRDEAKIERNKEISKIRYVVERTFGTLKRRLMMRRSWYIGSAKTRYFVVMRAMCYNLIRAVNLI